jgi:hypothetical protein
MQTTVLRHCTQATPSIHPQLAAKTPPQGQSPKQKPAQPLPHQDTQLAECCLIPYLLYS